MDDSVRGQHRNYNSGPSAGARNSGQRSIVRNPRAFVGDASGGEGQNIVPGGSPGMIVDTTTGSAGPLSPGERKGGVDD